jgi:hypothetical protein
MDGLSCAAVGIPVTLLLSEPREKSHNELFAVE